MAQRHKAKGGESGKARTGKKGGRGPDPFPQTARDDAGQQKRDAETRYRSPYGQHSGQTAYVWLNDLVGARGSSADDTLRQRGFVDKGGYKSNNQTFSTWWNARTRQCMQVVVGDGRVRSINAMVEGNCL